MLQNMHPETYYLPLADHLEKSKERTVSGVSHAKAVVALRQVFKVKVG